MSNLTTDEINYIIERLTDRTNTVIELVQYEFDKSRINEYSKELDQIKVISDKLVSGYAK